VSRALRALSSAYVERRSTIAGGAALEGRGKRAAFALFYGPLHFLLVQHIVRSLADAVSGAEAIVDLGCGTGVAGAAWATACAAPRRIVAIDRNAWALGEARQTYHAFDLPARTRQENVVTSRLLPPPASVVAAYTINELEEAAREDLLERLLARSRGHLLIVEPLAGAAARWWHRWRDRFEAAGGRGDEWRFRVELPPIVAKLDRAAGLDHREITGRSLFVAR
jgi:Methyltransferase domain